MNESDTVPARAPTQVTALAAGKLRSLGNRAAALADNGPRLDAFAEVFAHMASSPNAPQLSESNRRPASDEELDVNFEGPHLNDRLPDHSLRRREHDSSSVNNFESGRQAPYTDRDAGTGRSRTDHPPDRSNVQASTSPNHNGPAKTSEAPDPMVDPALEPEPQIVAKSLDGPSEQARPASEIDSESLVDRRRYRGQDDRPTIEPIRPEAKSVEPRRPDSGEPTAGLDQLDSTSDATLPRDQRHDVRARGDKASESPLPETSGSATESDGKRQSVTHPRFASPNSASEHHRSPHVEQMIDSSRSDSRADMDGLAAQTQRATPNSVRSWTGSRTESRLTVNSLQPAGDGARTSDANAPARRADKAGGNDAVARVKLVQRVSRAFQHLGPEGGIVRLRLAPAELGSVRVEMRIQQRKVEARVIAETEAASSMLREHLPDLRARLESYGMQIEKIEIEQESQSSLTGNPFESRSGRDHDERQQRRDVSHDLDSGQANRVESASVAASSGPAINSSSTGVDIRL